MELRPCSGCRRHVAVDAATCPFCSASITSVLQHLRPGRVARAAVFSAALAGCWTNKSEPKHVQQEAEVRDAAVVAPDAQVVLKGPPTDDNNGHYQNHPCVDTPQGPMCAPYGAPPQRRRIV